MKVYVKMGLLDPAEDHRVDRRAPVLEEQEIVFEKPEFNQSVYMRMPDGTRYIVSGHEVKTAIEALEKVHGG